MHARLAVTLSIMLAACGPVTVDTPFDVSEATYIKAQGTGVIEGQAFLRQKGGTVVTAAGAAVVLMPATKYTSALAKAGSEKRLKPLSIATEARTYMRETIADSDGRFRFDRVPPGQYYLMTEVTWKAYEPSIGMSIPQGGRLFQSVALSAGERKSIIMTR